MTIQLPPNSTGTTLSTVTVSGADRQIIVIGDPTTSGNQVTVGANGAAYVSGIDGNKVTATAAVTNINIGTGATTVLWQVVGSATKTVRVVQIRASGTTGTAAAYYDMNVVRSTTAISGGTASAATVIATDSSDNASVTATAQAFTAAPTAGTAAGNLDAVKYASVLTGTVTLPQVALFQFGNYAGGKAAVARGVAQSIDLKIAGATPANSSSWDFAAIWTEE